MKRGAAAATEGRLYFDLIWALLLRAGTAVSQCSVLQAASPELQPTDVKAAWFIDVAT
jgi:hypothetical protein